MLRRIDVEVVCRIVDADDGDVCAIEESEEADTVVAAAGNNNELSVDAEDGEFFRNSALILFESLLDWKKRKIFLMV